MNHTEKLIFNIQAQAKDVIDNLQSFIKDCEKKVIEIQSTMSISVNSHCNPLGKALISSSPQCFLDTLIGSDIVIRDIEKLFMYIPSPLDHSINNFASFTAGFSASDSIYIYPSKKVIKNDCFTWASRILPVDFDILLITGGYTNKTVQNRCFTLNINTGCLSDAPAMKIPRERHALTWFNGFPCVIGGSDGNKSINNAEILVGVQWVNISPLNIPRNSFTAINHKGIIWCFGGKSQGTNSISILDTIEKFENNCWKVLNLKLNQPCDSLGALSLENQILLYGGGDADDAELTDVYTINTDYDSIFRVGSLRKPAFVTQNPLFITSEKLFIHNDADIVIEIELKILMTGT